MSRQDTASSSVGGGHNIRARPWSPIRTALSCESLPDWNNLDGAGSEDWAPGPGCCTGVQLVSRISTDSSAFVRGCTDFSEPLELGWPLIGDAPVSGAWPRAVTLPGQAQPWLYRGLLPRLQGHAATTDWSEQLQLFTTTDHEDSSVVAGFLTETCTEVSCEVQLESDFLDALHNVVIAHDAALAVVGAHDSDHRLLCCSKGYEELTGYSASEVVGMTQRFLQCGDLCEEIRACLAFHGSAAGTGEVTVDLLQGRRKTGEKFLYLSLLRSILWHGKIAAVLVVQRDMTNVCGDAYEALIHGQRSSWDESCRQLIPQEQRLLEEKALREAANEIEEAARKLQHAKANSAAHACLR